jgi:tRNA modification GTPase
MSFSTDDTIAAIATASGRSGVGIVRLSGPESAGIACALIARGQPLEPRHATLARLAASASIVDQVIVTHFPAPHSYTGEDVTEISAHGSPVVLQAILRAAIDRGARLAEPGEFTLRAFLHGKLDLIQAEAVADLVNAVTPLQARTAFDQLEGTLTMEIGAIESLLFNLMARLEASLDFPDEGYHFVAAAAAREELKAVRDRIGALIDRASRGRLIREGAQVAIVGTPNVGKSSLFNALLRANRAIVTPIPGTTRDLVTERADLGGVSVALVDTAGLRDSADVIEQEGISRARQAAAIADLTIVVLDGSRPLAADDRALIDVARRRPHAIAINKSDLPAAWRDDEVREQASYISALTGAGVDALIDRSVAVLGGATADRDDPLVTNVRHVTLLERAAESLARAVRAVSSGEQAIPEEFVLADLQDAAQHLQEITGKRTTDDMLRHIFQNFCIGK